MLDLIKQLTDEYEASLSKVKDTLNFLDFKESLKNIRHVEFCLESMRLEYLEIINSLRSTIDDQNESIQDHVKKTLKVLRDG